MANKKNMYPTPKVGLDQVQRAWFVHEDTVHAVMLCTPDIFQAFIASIAPSFWDDEDGVSVLASRPLDAMDRWFLLWALDQSHVALPLYPNKQCATIALRRKSERAMAEVV